jgi:hypothetical protein
MSTTNEPTTTNASDIPFTQPGDPSMLDPWLRERYAPFASALDAIVQGETEGLDGHDEVVAYARALVDTDLVNSTGSNQRFIRDFLDSVEFSEEDLAW